MADNTKKTFTDRVYIYDHTKKTVSGYDGELVISEPDRAKFAELIADISASETPVVHHCDLSVLDPDGHFTLADIGFVCAMPHGDIVITVNDSGMSSLSVNDKDSLTGLYRKAAFLRRIQPHIETCLQLTDSKCVIIYFDVQRFKTINDMFGSEEGDRLLAYIAGVVETAIEGRGAACRIDSDRFVLAAELTEDPEEFTDHLLDEIVSFDLPFEIACNAGIYILDDETISPEFAIDRAIMAQSPIKGSYTRRHNVYTEILRRNLLTEQEISGIMKAAVKNEEFVVHYQPQYDHSTGMIVGAEGLVRWMHPEKGMISPGTFIPVFEKNGFITQLDLYVFEQVCKFLRRSIDNNCCIVPISTNLTRYDIFSPGFIDKLEETRNRYDVPAKYLRIEITESVALGNTQFINESVRKLHNLGYIVEMDDFGSGYSSLNILKDIDFDIIKLDMKFLEDTCADSKRGGTILSSVVRMVNWLGLPIIAEGVETVQQADFLRSIGCNYIQGFLYSKPLPENEFLELVNKTQIGTAIPQMKLVDLLDAGSFWSNDSIETLIFSNFVGGACIFEYKDDSFELLRVNQKYLAELGMNLTEKELIGTNMLKFLDERNRKIYIDTLERAYETSDEQECETWRTITSQCCGVEKLCIRTTIRLIGKSKTSRLYHAMIRNITAEKMHYGAILDSEHRFKMASEQANIYYWEYNVATHEMRPCFRCMRDLGLPALLTNYPDSAIEMGIFPQDYADMYRDWHRQIAEGVETLEAVIPLTAGRVPFHVRYTTEFDDNHRPIKAYGSATLVVD